MHHFWLNWLNELNQNFILAARQGVPPLDPRVRLLLVNAASSARAAHTPRPGLGSDVPNQKKS